MIAPVVNLYVHVPFCEGKCDYCGFYSVAADAATRAAYALLPGRELAARLAAGMLPYGLALRTLYLGGGTPGVLGAAGLRTLADGLRQAADLRQVAEWTVELNPASTTPGLAEALAALGGNRVSLGAQCFDDQVLRAIGRRHCAADIDAAVRAVHAAGIANVGLDLIAALPGMSPAAWKVSIERALALEVAHLSVYALSLEPGTPLARRVAAGAAMPDAETQLAALAAAEKQLIAAGFARYEISNYARPGRECRHNVACWSGEDYLGLGPAAASRVGRRRWTNRPDVAAYAAGFNDRNGGPAAPRSGMPARRSALATRDAPQKRGKEKIETLDAMADVTERFVFGLRLGAGVDPEVFARRWPAAQVRLGEWRDTLAVLAAQGVVESGATGTWRLTARGREVADAVIRELV